MAFEEFQNNAGIYADEAAAEAPFSTNSRYLVTGQHVLFDNKTLSGVVIVNGCHTIKCFDKN